jgi:hypothetical protein
MDACLALTTHHSSSILRLMFPPVTAAKFHRRSDHSGNKEMNPYLVWGDLIQGSAATEQNATENWETS